DYWFLLLCLVLSSDFFFQAEDGIRDRNVTGVQTCALPILMRDSIPGSQEGRKKVKQIYGKINGKKKPVPIGELNLDMGNVLIEEIGRASCRERVELSEGGVSLQER